MWLTDQYGNDGAGDGKKSLSALSGIATPAQDSSANPSHRAGIASRFDVLYSWLASHIESKDRQLDSRRAPEPQRSWRGLRPQPKGFWVMGVGYRLLSQCHPETRLQPGEGSFEAGALRERFPLRKILRRAYALLRMTAYQTPLAPMPLYPAVFTPPEKTSRPPTMYCRTAPRAGRTGRAVRRRSARRTGRRGRRGLWWMARRRPLA